jgi:pumilio RNA-binding family
MSNIYYSFNEKYLLGSLVYDLNDSNLNQNNNQNFNNISKIKKNNFYDLNKSSNSNRSTKDSSFIFLSKEEILNSLQNQKSALNLQSQIKNMNSTEIFHIFFELKGKFCDIIKDKNGNYFCNDLFNLLNEKQRFEILQEISNEFLILANQNYSTHPIQTLIQLANTKEEINFFNYIIKDENSFKFLAMNQNGCFVIQKFLLFIPENQRTKINYFFLKLLFELSVDMYGVSIVKKFISYSNDQFILNQILQIIINNFLQISQNQYGNYLIQFLLEFFKDSKELNIIKNLIFLNFYELACNNYSFHICESYIKLLTKKHKKILLKNLSFNGLIYKLNNNKYGKFVIVKLKNIFN